MRLFLLLADNATIVELNATKERRPFVNTTTAKPHDCCEVLLGLDSAAFTALLHSWRSV